MRGDFQAVYQLAFFSVAVGIALLERVRGFQRAPPSIERRWTSNIGLFVTSVIISGLVLPIGVYGFAAQQPPGLMSRLQLPWAAELAATFLFLDLWKYWEHRLFHAIPLFWRVHLVHHSDTHVDVTTTERHHPVEVLLSIGTAIGIVIALGLSAAGVALYLIAATVVALASHANVRLPRRVERQLERVFVTPRFHALHHSDVEAQTNSNYGAVLTVWDRLFGTSVDPDRSTVPHFGLRYFHRPHDTRLARVLMQPLLFRRGLAYPERLPEAVAATAHARAVRMSSRDARIFIAGATGCVLMTFAMWPALLQLTALWRNSEAYQFAWLVVPAFVYCFRWRLRASRAPLQAEPDFSGMPVVLTAAALYAAGGLVNIDAVQQFALLLALQGVALSTLGCRCYRRFLPVFLLLFFMFPLNDVLTPVLRSLTLESMRVFAMISGLPHSVDGFVIHIGTHRYIVIDECAGLTFVMLASFLGYCFGLLLYRSFHKIAAMCLFGAVLGFTANVVRVNLIVSIDWVRDSQMDLAAHGAAQWIALFFALAMLFYALYRLPADSVASTVPPAPEPRSGPRWLAPVAAGLSALVITGGANAFQTDVHRSPRGHDLSMFPKRILDWDLVALPIGWSVDEALTSQSVEVVYHGEDRNVRVIVVEGLSSAAKLQQPRLAPQIGGTWREKWVRHEVGCRNTDCLRVVHTAWQREKSSLVQHTYFTYRIGDFTTDSKLALRVAHGWHRLMGTGCHPAWIALVTDDSSLGADEVSAVFETIVQATRESPA